MFLINPKRTQQRNLTTEVLSLVHCQDKSSTLKSNILTTARKKRRHRKCSSLSGLIRPKTALFFSYLFFPTVGLGSFEKIPDTAEQCLHFEAICNKNTAFAGTQSSRLTSLRGKFGPSPWDSFEVKIGSFAREKRGF